MRKSEILFSCGKFAEKLLIFLFHSFLISLKPYPISVQNIINKMRDDFDYIDLRYFRKRINYTLKKFEKEGLISIKRKNTGEFIVSFTEKGMLFAKMKNLANEFKKCKKIKGKFKRLVFFDIPEEKRRYRNAFRNFLRLMGYKEIQRSVFIGEYENFEDLRIIILSFGLEDYVKTGLFVDTEIKREID